jgi:hypothetical protein
MPYYRFLRNVIASLIVVTPLAVSAADGARFPAQVTAPPLEMTGIGYSAPTPSPAPHFPAAVSAAALTMTGIGYAVPTPSPAPHFPAAVQAPPIQMTGIGGS